MLAIGPIGYINSSKARPENWGLKLPFGYVNSSKAWLETEGFEIVGGIVLGLIRLGTISSYNKKMQQEQASWMSFGAVPLPLRKRRSHPGITNVGGPSPAKAGGAPVKTEATLTHEAGTCTNPGGDPSTTEEGPQGPL